MKAAVYTENGPPEVFRYEDVPDPVREPGGIGDKFTTVHPFGSHAELRALPARNTWRIPAGASVREAQRRFSQA